jgi:asparagine synthase (glutamine-hydrolysing)
MCGIAGLIDINRGNKKGVGHICELMTDKLFHRGPDASGVWVNNELGVSLGHRRLSIIDISNLGEQPMKSHSKRFTIVYNGEIYNHIELRNIIEKDGVKFSGTSDTEILLASIEKWGVKKAISKFTGMFAFVVWDSIDRKLYLARDRIGEKPLYYGWINNVFVFASELKAFKVHPQWEGNIDRGVLALYLKYLYVPSPFSIYEGIQKLLPGTLITIEYDKLDKKIIKTQKYWTLNEQKEEKIISNREYIGKLDSLLKKTIANQLVSDVPIGAFLSGGIDSSLIVSIMQSVSNEKVKTFTIGFQETAHNEAEYAKSIANYLKTDHTELYLTPDSLISVIPIIPNLYDEPFADSSQIPTYLLAKLAKKSVTVCLSGDGGDELFAGYNRYFIGDRFWKYSSYFPLELRRKFSSLIKNTTNNSQTNSLIKTLGLENFNSFTIDKRMKFANYIDSSNIDLLYDKMITHWSNSINIVKETESPKPSYFLDEPRNKKRNFIDRAMQIDIISFLPDDILVKVDRATMGVSLESRAPFLNHEIVEFSQSIPITTKYFKGKPKWVLRQLLDSYLPKYLTERPKRGFTVPIADWLRGPLRPWAESYLNEKRLLYEGFFDSTTILKMWSEHLSKTRNWQHQLWAIIMFQVWLEDQ